MMRKRQIIKLTIAAGLPLILCAVWYSWLSIQIDDQQERNHILEEEIARIDPLIREIKDLERWRQELLDLMRSYEEIRRSSGSDFIEIIPELSKRIPQGITLQKVTFPIYDGIYGKSELYFEGEALSKEHVQALQEAMGISEIFIELTLEFIEDPVPGKLLKFGMRLKTSLSEEPLSEEDS